MSVINKMLRDLDSRRADGVTPERVRPLATGAIRGTVSVGMDLERNRTRWRPWLGALFLLGLMAAASWYWLNAGPSSAPAPVPGPDATRTSSRSTEVTQDQAPVDHAAEPSAPIAAAPVATAEPVQTQAGPAPLSPTLATAAPSRVANTPPQAVPPRGIIDVQAPRQNAPASTTPSAVETQGKLVDSQHAMTESQRIHESPRAQAATQPPAHVPPPAAQSSLPQRRIAVQETLAQSQRLWGSGSRDAALELMREAVAMAERAPDSDVARRSLASLVRELVRMELAFGRPAAVLALLSRQEAALSDQADLWAVRGNAAQRLGRHAESVQAYERALQLRPDESRWMLGAAVSLAAQGQLEAAGRLADKARAAGDISSEVLAYLRQSGVPLK